MHDFLPCGTPSTMVTSSTLVRKRTKAQGARFVDSGVQEGLEGEGSWAAHTGIGEVSDVAFAT